MAKRMSASRRETRHAWLTAYAAVCCVFPHAWGVTYTPVSFNVCGSQFTDGNGATWYGKSFISASSSGAGCANTTSAITVGTACSPASGSTICSQPQLQQMLQYEQLGYNLAYTNVGVGGLGKKNTTYAITLYFADLNATAAGERVFNIQINGQTVATNFDVYALGGGGNSAVSFAAPAFYSGSRTNFDINLPTVAGTASIMNGVSFQFATGTNATLTPSTATWGDSVLLEIYCNSLNPALGNLTGSYNAYIVGGNIPASTIMSVTGGAGGSLAQAYGAYSLNTSLLTNCTGGAVSLRVTFNDPAELYGNSEATVSITLAATCSASTTAPATTSAPPTTTAAPPTTIAPDTTTAAPGTSTPTPPTTTALDTTSAAPGTSTPAPPTTTAPGTTTVAQGTSTPGPPTTTAPDATTAAPGTSTPAPPITTVSVTSTTPAPTGSLVPTTTFMPDTTSVPETSSAPAGTTLAPAPTTLPAPPTSAAPESTLAPVTSTVPGTTASPYNVTMQMAIYPDPPIAGGQTTISGEATSDDGTPPTGDVAVLVDGSVIGTTPLVPVNDTSQTPLAHTVETSSKRNIAIPSQSHTSLQQSFNLAVVGRSVFSYTFPAPSTPGTHTIMAVAVSGGTTIPISAPLMVNITVVPPANMTLTFDGGQAVGLIGPAHHCKALLTAVANVTGPANATSVPTGNVTLAITDAYSTLFPVHLVTDKVLRSDGKATFSIDPNRAAAAALDMLGGLFTGEHATISKMPPGAYNMTATYNGDGIYPPATAFAKLLISPTCLFTTIVLS